MSRTSKDLAVFRKAFIKIIDNKSICVEELCKDFKISDKTIIKLLEKTHEVVNSKYYTKEEVVKFIDKATNILLSYARHNYSKSLALTNDDNFDTLSTGINFLGQELIFSTVTTHYLEDVFNSIDDMLIVVDNLGYILFVNKAICKILGYKEKEILRQNIKLILNPDVEFLTIVENKIKRNIFEYHTKSNELIPVSLSISNFSRKDNPFMGHVIIARDISLTLKYEKEIEEQNKIISKSNEELKIALVKAEESERLKTAFLANMSHEIRTPLNGIMGFSELLQQPENSQEDYSNFGNIILSCSNQLLGIVNDVLDISKIEAGLMQVSNDKCNINYILDDLFLVYKQKISAANKQIEFTLNKSLIDKECYVISDELRLRQIISNLLDNAIKFTDSGKVEIEYKVNDNFLEFCIKDTGIGISDSKIKTIFKPFVQAAKSTTKLYGGTGLGLAIAFGLVNLLGGKIKVTSVINHGSTFSFTIPYFAVESFNDGIENKKVLRNNNSHKWEDKTILIVEDDPNSTYLLRQILMPTHVNIIYTQYGKEALKIFNFRKDINLIIIDYNLPDIDGCEIAKAIRKINKDIPIIMQTAYATKQDKEKCFQMGCSYFIPKPVKSSFLLSLISRYFMNVEI